jgi:hypothetical protein
MNEALNKAIPAARKRCEELGFRGNYKTPDFQLFWSMLTKEEKDSVVATFEKKLPDTRDVVKGLRVLGLT